MTARRPLFREPFCGISHLSGALLSVVGLIVLLVISHGRPLPTLGFSLYGGSLILLYTVSTLYHSLHVTPKQALLLQRCDHAAIFLLIAGTYAPVCLISLPGIRGWSLLSTVYGLALVGIGIVLFWKTAPHWVRVALYIGMGWLAVITLPWLRTVLPTAALAWLIAGGIVYTLGTVVYATDRPHLWPGKFSAHDLWHVFVLGGSACHFILMLYIVTLL